MPFATACLLLPAVAAGRTVDLTIVPTVAGRILLIEGAADLPDRTYIDWELRHTLRYELMKRVPFEHMTTEGRAVVHNGRFRATVDLGRWPAGPVEVWIGFQPIAFGGPQPPVITRVFGENGERLEGANVECLGQFRNMFRAATVAFVSLEGSSRPVSAAVKSRPNGPGTNRPAGGVSTRRKLDPRASTHPRMVAASR